MDRISVNSQIHFGKPCVSETRITVQSVLELLNEGLTFEEITQDYYPDLEIEDVRACLQYAISLCDSFPVKSQGLQETEFPRYKQELG